MSLAPLLLILPALGVVINGLFGRKFVEHDHEIGEKWSGWFAVVMAISTFVVTIILWNTLRNDHSAQVVYLFDWINIPSANFNIPWALHIDTLSVTMLFVITGVGSLIHIYAIGYMHGDRDFSRFFTYLNLFLFFMILLVTGSSYLTLFVGWEGVGVASFLLIGFWFSKDKVIDGKYEGVKNADAARKAFVVNRIGDLCMIIAMSLTFWGFGTMEFGTAENVGVFGRAIEVFKSGELIRIAGMDWTPGMLISVITLFLLLGATGKSAQIPLFIWLPDAMAGPTPVSALMHAATMVTSGIYLLVRSNVLLEIARASGFKWFDALSTPDLVALIGASTALYAGLIAFTQFDIKKVLAYSTVSQLGFMIAAVGMGAYVAGMFHLITHAFFKALLFMGAGSVIHGMEHGHHHLHHAHDDHGHGHGDDDHGHHHQSAPAHPDFDPQDMRFMGGLRSKMPYTTIVYIIGALALAGIFPFAGFWSKDEILAHASSNNFVVIQILLTLAAICTAFYMGRQLKMVFFGKPRDAAAEYAHESGMVMIRPLAILAILSIIGGGLNFPHLVEQAHNAHALVQTWRGKPSLAGEETAEHGGETDAAETSAEPLAGIPRLSLEHWLEYSLSSFALTDEGVVHMPHTPINIQYSVAIISTLLAVASMIFSFFFVYGKRPQNAHDKDPIIAIPPFSFLRHLPINSLYMNGFVPLFNRFATFCAETVDWAFYHDAVHERLIRNPFIQFSSFVSNGIDRTVLDGGLVLGVGRIIRGTSSIFKRLQTGYVRNYAFSLFLGVVALVVYFIFMI